MKVVNLLTAGGLGGIETLCREIAQNSTYEDSYIFLFKGGVIYEQMKEAGNRVFCLEGTGKLSLEKYKKLVELTKDADVIVVHHKDIFLQTYYLLLRKKYPEKKFVYTAHSCFSKDMDSPNKSSLKVSMMRFFMKKAILAADQFVAVSKAGLNSYDGFVDMSGRRTAVVYNGISRRFFEETEVQKQSPDDRVNLLYVGRLVSVKGVRLLLESMAGIVKRHDVFLKIVGDGPQRSELEEFAAEKGLSDVVSFEGSKTEVINYFKESDIFIYPSVWQEVFGISIVEAMSMGNICIANRVGGIPEIINDGVNGFLTDEATSKGIERALEKAIAALHDDEHIAKEARKTAQSFSIDKTVAELQKVYSNLITDV